jgi:hypothetical protein
VVEAIYALRPDLAPAPRLGADDILASVTRGPLADATATPSSVGSREGAEVVVFPGDRVDAPTVDSDPDLATRRTRRMWLWVGGTGGVGLALVAAATLALVALPGLRPEREQEAPVATAFPAAQQAPPPRPAAELQKEADAVAPASSLDGKMGNQVAAPSEPAAGPPPAAVSRAARPDVSSGARDNEVQEMVGLGAVGGMKDEAAVIPEVTAAAESESNTGSAAMGAPAAKAEKAEAKQKSDAYAQAALDDDTLARIEDAVKRSERVRKKDPAAAAAILAEVIAPPADVGQTAAAMAAETRLEAGDADAAVEIARQGLALSEEPTPERARLVEIESAAVTQQQAQQPD